MEPLVNTEINTTDKPCPSPPYNARYSRQLALPGFGPEAQDKLAKAAVLVVGAGGLGVPVLQYLAAMGVGRLGIVDDDAVSLSNLHRQVLYTTAEQGQPKATLAAARLKALNPEIHVDAHALRLDPGNALELLSPYDVIVDATDNFAARYLINDACVILGKPFIYGAVHQFEGFVSVFNYTDGPTYRCLYPKPPADGEIPDCDAAGVLGVVPGMIGCRQALEVVKLLTGIGSSLSGFLMVYDFLHDRQYRVRLRAVPGNKQISRLQDDYAAHACRTKDRLLEPAELKEWMDDGETICLIDLREPVVFSAGHLPGAVNLPLGELHGRMIRPENRVVLYCQRGNRSARAFAILQEQYPAAKLHELAGGIESWIKRYGSI